MNPRPKDEATATCGQIAIVAFWFMGLLSPSFWLCVPRDEYDPAYQDKGMIAIMVLVGLVAAGTFLYATRGYSKLLRLFVITAMPVLFLANGWWNTHVPFKSTEFLISFLFAFGGGLPLTCLALLACCNVGRRSNSSPMETGTTS